MKKYHLVPYTENIPEILKEDDEPDDIKLKKIIQTLHKMLRPYTSNESSAHIDEVKATPISTEERTTQTSEEQRGDEPSVIVNYLSNTYRQKGRSLLALLRPVLTWDPQTLENIDRRKTSTGIQHCGPGFLFSFTLKEIASSGSFRSRHEVIGQREPASDHRESRSL